MAIISRFFYIFFLIILASCQNIFGGNKYAIPFNTEIMCPFRPSMLVKFVAARELKNSAIRDYLGNKRSNNDRNFTIFYLSDGRSFSIKIPPQQIIECEFRQSRFGAVDSNYVHSF